MSFLMYSMQGIQEKRVKDDSKGVCLFVCLFVLHEQLKKIVWFINWNGEYEEWHSWGTEKIRG